MPESHNWAKRANTRVNTLIDRLPRTARILLAIALFALTWILLFIWLSGRAGTWAWAATASAVVSAKISRGLIAPYWRSRSEKTKRLLSGASAFLLPLFLLSFAMWQIPIAAQQSESAAGLPLIAVWAFYVFIAGSSEPDDFPLDHLRMRIARAAFFRVATNWCGIIGLVWFLHRTITDEKLKGPLLGASFTLIIVVTVASLKTYTRVRKLCTHIYSTAQSLTRDLEEVRAASDGKERAHGRATARRTWDDLRRLLHNRIDTGFHRYGIFVLPKEAIAELAAKIALAIDADPATEDAHESALADLRIIQRACEVRLDDVA
ncbi:hypothetical protein ACFVIM_30135 [Streptomyces sp. NPDC057638]|uniref:hypothetical protein n=1 Tax=Streptomyces sp. NPDC057638 TaxID=3346190 RepID=UPI0036A842E3